MCEHEFIAAKRNSTVWRNGDLILPRKKTLLAKLKVAGHVSILATEKKKWGKVMPGDTVTSNARPGLLLNS